MSKKIAKQGEPADHLVVFQETAVRRAWHGEEWWFSVADVCGVLTDSPDAGAYWRKLKQLLSTEGSEVVTFCHVLKLEAPDGKLVVSKENYLTPFVAAAMAYLAGLPASSA